ncbi:hypothetical protein S245_064322, partial [Arachis hypogaea]
VNDQNEPILGDDGEPIPNARDPSLWKDHSAELLSNLRCKTLSDFRWYKDTFLTRVYTREDSQQLFWKENFLAGLPKSLGDKVRDKIRSLTPDGIIPYDALSYSQIISFIQKMIRSNGNLLVRKNKTVSIWELYVNNLVFLLVIQGNLKDHPIKKFLNLILKRISEDQEKVFKEPRMKKVSKRISKSIPRKTPLFAIHVKNQDILANT